MPGERDGWLRARTAVAARRGGRRGAFLAFLTLLNWLYGYSLLTAPAAASRAEDLLLPWTAWGAIWAAAGCVTAAGIFARRDRVPYGLCAAWFALWGLLQVDLWLIHRVAGGWAGAVIWFALAATVLVVAGWAEPGPVIIIPEVRSPSGKPAA